MDRKIIYPAQIPLVEDQLQTSRFVQIALGRLAAGLYGEIASGVSGLSCTSTGGLGVTVGPGQIVTTGEVDYTAYGVLPASSDPVQIQYLLNESVSLAVPAAGATYQVYATLAVEDIDPGVLPFYNSANPEQVYAGPSNTGTSSATVRSSFLTMAIATTIPAGGVPLWVVTVPAGATAITADMIAKSESAPFWLTLPDLYALFNQYFNKTESDARYLLLGSTALQKVTGPVTFSGATIVPAVTDWTSYQAVGATDARAQFMPSQSVFGQSSQSYYTPTPSSSQTTTHIVDLTFTAPYDGLVYASASFNVSNVQPSQCQGLIQIEGSSYQPTSGSTVWSDTTLFPMSGSGVMRVKKGDSITIVASYNVPPSSSSFASVGQTITYTFTPAGY